MTANVSVPWTDAERRQLQQLHANGMSLAQIGAHLGRSKNSVSRQVQLLALRRERIGKPPASPRTHPKGPVGHPKAPKVTLAPLPSLRGILRDEEWSTIAEHDDWTTDPLPSLMEKS